MKMLRSTLSVTSLDWIEVSRSEGQLRRSSLEMKFGHELRRDRRYNRQELLERVLPGRM